MTQVIAFVTLVLVFGVFIYDAMIPRCPFCGEQMKNCKAFREVREQNG